jgi:lysophospholipase L1-like esterase
VIGGLRSGCRRRARAAVAVRAFLIGLALSGCAGSAPRVGLAIPEAEPLRILALGDSYTIGEGVSPGERWPAVLADRLSARGVRLSTPEIIARTGWTTDELWRGIDARRPRGRYGLVTLLIGVNDQYRGRPVAGYRAPFSDLLGRAIGFAGGRADRVVVLSIPDWGVTPFAARRDRARIASEIDAYNAVNRVEAARAGVAYVDVTELVREAASDSAMVVGDGLHPSAAMYARWVERALPTVLEALGIGRSRPASGS